MALEMRIDDRPANDDDIVRFCELNPLLRVERTARGALLVTPPSGGWAGRCGAELARQIGNWNERAAFGYVFDASTGFRLPDGAILSPDVSIVARADFEALDEVDRQRWLTLAPLLILEVGSPRDAWSYVEEKLRQFRRNGTRIALGFDPHGSVAIHDERGERTLERPGSLALRDPALGPGPLELQLERLYLERMRPR
jgi:Uma2 family endonuclease